MRLHCTFHSGLSLQTLEISRDGYSSETATAFFIEHGAITRIEATVDLDSVPLLGVADVIDSYLVVLTPEEWNSVEPFATSLPWVVCGFAGALARVSVTPRPL